MTLKTIIYSLVDNIVAQINADQRHKAIYTLTFIQHMLVSHINALAAVGVIDDDPATPEEAWNLLSEKLKLAGLVSLEAQMDSQGVSAQKINDISEFPWTFTP